MGERRTGTAVGAVAWANAELLISFGGPSAIMTPLQFGTTARLTDVDGSVALIFDNGVWSAVSWSPVPEVVIRFAAHGAPEEVLSIARSIGGVDAAVWEAASTDVTGQDDGCQSSFFC